MELQIRNLSKTCPNGVEALNAVTLTIPPACTNAMLGSHHLPEESFCLGNVAFCTGHELNHLSLPIDPAKQVLTCLPDFDFAT